MKYYEKAKIKAVPVQDAVGKVLLHDITQIVPDLFKGSSFRKGHIITDADVEALLNLGKQNIYVAGLNGEVHENDAALRIARAAMGNGIDISMPKEGKVGFSANTCGLLKVNVQALEKLNGVEDVIFATLHTDQPVEVGQELAGTRVIPLSIDEKKVEEAEILCKKYFPIIEIKPFAKLDVGLVVTGSEVFSGRIRDGFGPVVAKKFKDLGSNITRKIIVSDEISMTVSAIKDLLAEGAQMIAVTGGMSVDPDDLTPAAIRAAGGEIVFYGAPVLPGAMFMLAYIGTVPVIGLPGCVMYHRASIFDLVVPKLLAGDTLKKTDIVKMGHGGFCASCKECRFPSCSFGK
ncbi:MAG: molybdopterin-binding protein [Proteobacteria bacterium]|nr:molybdopterin-binding protein [Pseudomonadota bacterium]MBU1583850.1 molybdopterin-binding protein [Pseudomonadota bacterium]MBU2453301.1 molybdopterin-binding protein [Pseudomonadota bacterium]MBU2630180.1 molybdopterin-binding protein [Pseudomonadota bacterium]